MKETIKWTGVDGKDRAVLVDDESKLFAGVCYAKDFQEKNIEFYYSEQVPSAQDIIDSCDGFDEEAQ